MHYAEIKYNDIANGPGIRTTLFVSGCTHHCYNCFNEVAWDFNYGKEWDPEIEDTIIKSLEPEYVTGITLLGGEPMEFINQEGLYSLLTRVKETYPNKTIWCFTGYLFEELLKGGKMHGKYTDYLLEMIDVIVDGEFVQEEYDITLIFKGSRNQRTIDVQASLKEGRTVVMELKKETLR